MVRESEMEGKIETSMEMGWNVVCGRKLEGNVETSMEMGLYGVSVRQL